MRGYGQHHPASVEGRRSARSLIHEQVRDDGCPVWNRRTLAVPPASDHGIIESRLTIQAATRDEKSMHPYLERTQYAAETLINAIFHEDQALARLVPQLRDAERRIARLGQSVHFLALNPDLDDEGLGQLKYAEAWDNSNEAARLITEISQSTQSVADRQDATTALCGTLLQAAKRGITGPNRQRHVSQPGWLIHGLHLEGIIWAGPNQAMHPEDPPEIHLGQRVFGELARVCGPQFDAAAGMDLARKVVDLLEWSVVANYTCDMESILP